MLEWKKLTNDEMAMHLEMWLEFDGRVSDKRQKDFFGEVIWLLRLTQEEE